MMLGGDSNGVPFHVFCHDEWRDKYGDKPPWLAKDYTQLATALKALGGEEKARAAWRMFLASTDQFYEGHPPGKFLGSLSRWVAKAPKPQKQVEGEAVSAALRRAGLMAKIYAEVEKDNSIPPDQKIAERSKRWKQIPLDG